jgi:hypothetical protein
MARIARPSGEASVTSFGARAAELEKIRRRLFSNPPGTVGAANAILRRTKRLYDGQIAEMRQFNASVDVFNRALRKLERKAGLVSPGFGQGSKRQETAGKEPPDASAPGNARP